MEFLATSVKKKLTVLTFARREARDEGRFTKQFWRCTSDTSAAVECAFLRGAIAEWCLSVEWRLSIVMGYSYDGK